MSSAHATLLPDDKRAILRGGAKGLVLTPMTAIEPDKDSVRLVMDLAWRDHHHAREQTWKALQIEAALAAGLVGIDWRFQNHLATLLTGVLVSFAAIFGMLISMHHRRVERNKFTQIYNCEKFLGLHREDLLPQSGTGIPVPVRLFDVFRFSVQNTSAFILRMHFAILAFAFIYVSARLLPLIWHP